MDGKTKLKVYNLCDTVKEKDDVMEVSQYKKKRECATSRLKVVSWIFIVLIVMLLATLITLTVKWRDLRQARLEIQEQTVCVKCSEMGLEVNKLSVDIEAEISKDDKDCNSTDCICCGKTSIVLNKMITKAIEQRRSSTRSILYPLVTRECRTTTEMKPSAQVNGVLIAQTERGHGNTIHWDKTDTSVLTGKISYKHGKLKVKQSGYYYIFSQLTFRNTPSTYSKRSVHGDTISLNEQLPSHLDHFIYHTPHETGKHEKILEGSKSRCEMASPNDEITSSLGAVFYLAADDEVFVKVSHIGLITPSKERNHFGLYMT